MLMALAPVAWFEVNRSMTAAWVSMDALQTLVVSLGAVLSKGEMFVKVFRVVAWTLLLGGGGIVGKLLAWNQIDGKLGATVGGGGPSERSTSVDSLWRQVEASRLVNHLCSVFF